MSDDIAFGDLEQSEPQQAIRPDRDAHFATAEVGQIGRDELLIFVDLDVMRDMEAHALSNTRVELGGVMLGQQQIDEQGRPFVVVTECLRAEHYEATSVNFKFTHETWSQITRQRSEFRPDLEMVGWYHTHPGLTVFLSGMDLFICNNFFNRPLDVALVIDPRGQDRGWFQWTDDDHAVTHRTGGFVMTTSRLRQRELDQFARIYNKEPMMNMDPRYSGSELAGNTQPLVHLMDNRKPVFELAVIGILVMQFLLVAVFAWRFLDSDEPQSAVDDRQKVIELEGKLETVVAEQNRSVREEAYREVLQTLVNRETGDPSLLDRFTKLKSEQIRMDANHEGQRALVTQLQFERQDVKTRLEVQSSDSEKLEKQLVTTRNKLGNSQDRVDELTVELEGHSKDAGFGATGNVAMPWWWLLIGTLLVAGAATALGVVWGRGGFNDRRSVESSRGTVDDFSTDTMEFSDETSSNADVDDPKFT